MEEKWEKDGERVDGTLGGRRWRLLNDVYLFYLIVILIKCFNGKVVSKWNGKIVITLNYIIIRFDYFYNYV